MTELDADWLPIRPGTDVAVMLGLMHTLASEGMADLAFLDSHCHGWPQLHAHLMGSDDGVAKTAEWAAEISEIPAETIRALAPAMVSKRSMLNIAWGVQRAHAGEHTWWSLVALASVLGQIGLPGGGFGFGYGAVGSIGNGVTRLPFPALPQGENPVSDFIPVARIADLLERSGEAYTYNGEHKAYPHIELVYWGRREPLSPPPGPQPVEPCLEPPGHRHRPRAVLGRQPPSGPTSCSRRRPPSNAPTSAGRHARTSCLRWSPQSTG